MNKFKLGDKVTFVDSDLVFTITGMHHNTGEDWEYNLDHGEHQFDESLLKLVMSTDGDSVNHPAHYCREGAMECIDEMLLIFGKEAVKNFCLCNAWKYRARAVNKNGEEDLLKSDWYLKKYKELGGDVLVG